jgi:hypothetical protein
VWQDVFAEEDWSSDINGKATIEQVFVQVNHRRFTIDSGIRDGNIDPSKVLNCSISQIRQLIRLRDIAGNGQGLAPRFSDLPSGVVDVPGAVFVEWRVRGSFIFSSRRDNYLGSSCGEC